MITEDRQRILRENRKLKGAIERAKEWLIYDALERAHGQVGLAARILGIGKSTMIRYRKRFR